MCVQCGFRLSFPAGTGTQGTRPRMGVVAKETTTDHARSHPRGDRRLADPPGRRRSQWTDVGPQPAPVFHPEVALRELLQNAHDSILRRRLEQPDWHGESRIEVHADTVQGIVRIVDTGAGLNPAGNPRLPGHRGRGLYARAAPVRSRGQRHDWHVRAGLLVRLRAGAAGDRAHHLLPVADAGLLLYLQQRRAVHGQPDSCTCAGGHRGGAGIAQRLPGVGAGRAAARDSVAVLRAAARADLDRRRDAADQSRAAAVARAGRHTAASGAGLAPSTRVRRALRASFRAIVLHAGTCGRGQRCGRPVVGAGRCDLRHQRQPQSIGVPARHVAG